MAYPPLREPLTDPRSGIISRPWGLFIQDVNNFITNQTTIQQGSDFRTLINIAQQFGQMGFVPTLPAGFPEFLFPPPDDGDLSVLIRRGFNFQAGPILFSQLAYVGKTIVGSVAPIVLKVPPVDACIVLELFAEAAASVAGLHSDYTVPPTKWRLLFLVNGAAVTITLNHQDPAANAADQFAFPGSANYDLAAGQVLGLLWHPDTSAP